MMGKRDRPPEARIRRGHPTRRKAGPIQPDTAFSRQRNKLERDLVVQDAMGTDSDQLYDKEQAEASPEYSFRRLLVLENTLRKMHGSDPRCNKYTKAIEALMDYAEIPSDD